jgi:TRAP-type C4-dicarboxylate transport system permease small subunit
MAVLRALNTVIEWMLLLVAGGLFTVFIGTIFYQVVARNWLSVSAGWTDEVALMCFVWSVFLGAAVAVRRRAHYVVDILPDNWVNTTNALRLFGALACLPVVYVLIVNGAIFTDMGWRRASVALQLPLAWVFMAIPVAGVAMALFSLEVIMDDIQRLRSGDPAGHPPEDP